MSEKGSNAFSIHGVFNYIWKISTMEIFIKYCKIYSLMKTTMAVITIYAEEIEVVEELKGDNGVVNYPIAHAEVMV